MERSTIHLLAKRGKSQRKIARELGISRVTVSRSLHEPVDKTPSHRERSSSVDPYEDQIKGWLQDGLSIVRMLELARADEERPYAGGRSVFSDAVRRIRQIQEQATADVPIRFDGLPGEYLQIDWGEVRHFPFTQHKPATRYFLAARLKYSRWSWIWWTTDMRQETLMRVLVACFGALGWVPWVLVFDNMKTVTTGRDPQNQAIWHPALLRLAKEFDFHPEACAVAAPNQKGSVESLVKWVKGNFLAGRQFADDADLAHQTTEWLANANARPSAATGEPPTSRLPQEAARGGVLPPTAYDYGFLVTSQVSAEALVPVEGNLYSVPVAHVGAPVTVRLHRERVVIWHDTEWLAEHVRARFGANARVIEPSHLAPLFAVKPRAQLMLYRTTLIGLDPSVARYVAEISRRRRDCLRPEILQVYALWEAHGTPALVAAMERASTAGVFGADYLDRLLVPADSASLTVTVSDSLPAQSAVDRGLSAYEAYVTGAKALEIAS